MEPITRSLTERAQLRFQILEKIFRQIGDEQSRLILMQNRGFSPERMAKELKISEPALHHQLSVARQQMRQLIRQYYS